MERKDEAELARLMCAAISGDEKAYGDFLQKAACLVRGLARRKIVRGGIDPEDLHRALGRIPEHRVVSDGQLVVRCNNEGVPFVLADPNAAVSQDLARIASELLGTARVPAAAGRR